jgi:hypothetical protein
MSEINQKWLQSAFQIKSMFFSVLFVLYIWQIQPMLMDLLTASQDGTGNFWLGWGLLFIPLFEFAGIFSKLPVSNYFRSLNPPNKNNVDAFVFIYIISVVLHLAAGSIYMFVCFQIIQGVSLNNGSVFYTVFSIFLLFIVIAREAFIIVILMAASPLPATRMPANNRFDQWLFNKVNANTIESLRWGDFVQDMAGDSYLFFYVAISFTVMWNFFVYMNPPDMFSPKVFFELLGVSIYFLMIYMQLRASSFPFEMNMIQSRKHWILYIASILLAALMSILPLLK